jgi:hypothetical protein
MSDQQPQRNTMTSRVISLRLPSAVDAALRRSAADAGISASGGADWLLRNSFSNCQVLARMPDCLEMLDAKLDIRVPTSTGEPLKSAAGQLGIPISVYIRKLLYHFFVTKHLGYVQSNGHYTLAGRHD